MRHTPTAEFVYLLRMDGSQIPVALKAIRRLRRARLDLAAAPECLRPFLRGGLGPVCELFAAHIDETVSDRRAADATIRFFGLNLLPENLDQIGSTVRVRSRADPISGPLGISPRQVEKIIARAFGELLDTELSAPPSDELWAEFGLLPTLADPFPLPVDIAHRVTLNQALWWGWAQIPDGDSVSAAALLYYEREHLLRPDSPSPASRTERARWRKLAWTVLQVAQYRIRQTPTYAGVDRLVGPRLRAVVSGANVERQDRDGIGALALLCERTDRPPLDSIEASIQLVRMAVRSGRDEATELLGIVRDALVRYSANGGRSVPAAAESKVLALSMILSREHRDISGIPFGQAALSRVDRLLDDNAGRSGVRETLLSDGLRINQELAELYDGLGRHQEAYATVREMRQRLDRLGDPEWEAQPNGWLQQWCLTAAAIDRHLARDQGRYAQDWLRRGARAADRAAELAWESGLPSTWGIAAETQRQAIALDQLRNVEASGRPAAVALDAVRRRLDELDRRCHRLSELDERSYRSAVLGVRLIAWRLALLQRDPAEIHRAQIRTLRQVGPWVLGADLDLVDRCRRASAQLGVPESATLSTGLRSRIQDRAALRS